MRILKLTLENFKTIYSGMKKKRITLNFDDSTSREMVLLVGPNGSGKTSILSQLHPFPYVGNMDVRNSQDPILEDEKGYKEIVIKHNGIIYIMAHLYTPTKDGKHKLICSFYKDNVNLNITGGVKSFYDLVYDEFGLTPAFLKIMRLGYNVTGIIDMGATERKNFMSFFLNEIEPYQDANKKIKEASKNIKNKIKYITENLNNIDIDKNLTPALIEKELKSLDAQIKNEEDSLEKVKQTLSVLKEGELTKEDKEKAEEYIDMLKSYNKHNFANIEEAKNKINENRKTIEEYDLKIKENTKELTNVKFNIAELNNSISDLDKRIEDVSNSMSLNKLAGKNTDELNNLKKQYTALITEFEKKKDPEIDPKKKMAYKVFYNTAERIEKIQDSVFLMDRDIYEYINRLFLKLSADQSIPNRDIPYFINRIYREIDSRLVVQRRTADTKAIVYTTPKGCSEYLKCPFYQIYVDSKYRIDDRDVDFYVGCKDVLNAFNKAYDMYYTLLYDMGYTDNKVQFGYLAAFTKAFLEKNIRYIEAIRKKLLYYSNYCEESESIESIREALASVTSQLNEIKEADAKMKECSYRIAFLNNEKNAKMESLARLKDTIDGLCIKQAKYETAIHDYSNDNQNLTFIVMNMGTIHEKIREYNLFRKKSDNIALYTRAKETLNDKILLLKQKKAKLKDTLYDLEYKNRMAKSLSDKKEELDDDYEDIMLLENATSNTKGIPLLFIRLYLKNIQIMANEIIHEMFSEDISLLDFHITETDFTIPYINNGIEVQDISLASQGEKSCFIIALSFAIIKQLSSKYNILLIDELDGPLYKENKEKFISIIDKQMDKLGCEQMFIITHNNIFENYPISLIQTGEMNTSAYTNAKKIRII